MEEISFTPKELKEVIDSANLIGSGGFGAVIEYKTRLLKIDINLYKKLKKLELYQTNRVVREYYEYENNDFQDRKQIEELVKKQKDITLTKLPEGIITLKDVSSNISPGIIIPYHKGYDKLENLDFHDYKRLLIILKKLLMAVRELEENKISQEDLIQYNEFGLSKRSTNVLYKDDTPQIIDMSGFFVKVGDKFYNAKNMYMDLSNILIDYCYFNNINAPYKREKVENYEQDKDIIDELERGLKRKGLL